MGKWGSVISAALWPILLLLAQDEPVRVTLRGEAFFSKGALERVRGGTPLEAGRLAVAVPGWFLNAALEPGEYSLWIAAAGQDFRLSLRNAAGTELGSDGFWIDPPTGTVPTAELAASDGAVAVTIRCDEVRLPFRFVPRPAVDAATPGAATRSGRILVTSELGAPELAEALAKELDASIDVHAALLGRLAPKGPFRVHLFREEKAYQAADKLVTGGRFQRNGAFASALTMQAYVWNVPRREAGLTQRTRAVILHEVGHLVAYATRPESTAWPVWLTEGLAEEGTSRALPGKDREAFDAEVLGRWRGAEAVGSLPPLQDLLTRYAGADLHGWYTSAYLFTRRAAGEEKLLDGLLLRLEGERLQTRSSLAAYEVVESRARAMWRAIREEAMKGPPPPQVVFGHLDRGEGEWRISTAPGSQGRVLLPSIACPAEGAVELSIAWEPAGGRQADLYLAVAAGRDSSQFLKVGILPKRIVLFRFFDERWEEWGRKDFAEPLAEGASAWHSVRASMRSKERTLAVTVDGTRTAEFPLKTFVPVEGTCVGIGGYDSVVHVKDVRAR